MNRRVGLLAVLALCVSGCGLFRLPTTPDFSDATVHDVMLKARSGNWTVRVPADSAPVVGRVRFVSRESARIGDIEIATRNIRVIERYVETDLGGKTSGAALGASLGFVVGYLGRGFWEYGYEQDCTSGCTLQIFVPAVGFSALIGVLLGSIVDPPNREWTVIWRVRQ